MKKTIISLLLLLFLFLVVGCGSENTPKETPTLDCDDLVVSLGNSLSITPTSSLKDAKFKYSVDGSCVSIYNDVVTGNDIGTANVTISIEGYDVTKTITITCIEPGLFISGPKTVVINETVDLSLSFVGIEETEDIVWKSSNNSIGRVAKGVVTGIGLGEFTVTAKNDDYSVKYRMEVVRPAVTDITVEDGKENIVFEIGASYELNYKVTPELASQEVVVESNNDCILVKANNVLKANKTGDAILKVHCKGDESIVKEVKVSVVFNEAPVFTKLADYEENITINYGSTLNIMQGLQVVDNSDGDLTATVTAENLDDLQKYGTREITLVATDRAGNKATFKRTVTIEWQYKTKFIGHQGCFYGLPNSEEAFLYAASVMHYQAMECDLKSTKDGVLVVCHDGEFGGASIANTNYADLAKLTETINQFGLPKTYYGANSYTGHICTFDRYLDICKEYGVMPIIELKGAYGMDSGNCSQLPTLMKILKDKGIYDNAVILTSMPACITYIRNMHETIKCQYLVNGASSDTVLDFCITNKCDVSVNVTYGGDNGGITDEYIKKYHDAGCEVSTWTFTSYCDYSQVQEWINKGVDYVTCDWHYLNVGKLTFK